MNQKITPSICSYKIFSKKTSFFWIFLVSAFFLFLPLAAHAKEDTASISKIILANEGGNLETYLWVEGAFTQKIQEAIQTGLPLTFSYIIILEKPRKLWPASELARMEITHTIHYNTLREYYTVTLSWEEKPRTTSDPNLAMAWMSHIEKLSIIPSDALEKGTTYRIRAKAKLSEFTLPLYLHRILFFLSFWDFETNWYSLEFTP